MEENRIRAEDAADWLMALPPAMDQEVLANRDTQKISVASTGLLLKALACR
jgi:hypothetical protein